MYGILLRSGSQPTKSDGRRTSDFSQMWSPGLGAWPIARWQQDRMVPREIPPIDIKFIFVHENNGIVRKTTSLDDYFFPTPRPMVDPF